jgi:hypothetical protein
MQENNFEGKVNKMMEEFRMEPSERVWGSIQADINGTKSRFGMVPIWLLTGCFLLTTFFLHDLEQKRAGSFNSALDAVVTSANKNNITDNLDKKLKPSEARKKLNRLPVTDNDVNQNFTKIIGTQNRTNQSVEIVNGTKRESSMQMDGSKDETEDIAIADDNKGDTLKQISSESAAVNNDTIANNKKSTAQQQNRTVNKNNGNKWDFFVAASAGKFYTANSYLGQVANAAYYDYNSVANGSGVPSGGFIPPSVVKPGLSFSATLKANRKLSNKTSLSLGLGYQYAGTFITTGQMLSGSAGQMQSGTARDSFAAGSLNKYHNKYYFIQLPIQIQSTIGRGNKFPLSWNAGFTLSRLISTTALQFNRQQGYYFKDNSNFNKTTIGLSAGLSVAILKNKKTQWLLGPQVYYSLTPVASSGWYDKTHYSFVGLQLQKKL